MPPSYPRVELLVMTSQTAVNPVLYGRLLARLNTMPGARISVSPPGQAGTPPALISIRLASWSLSIASTNVCRLVFDWAFYQTGAGRKMKVECNLWRSQMLAAGTADRNATAVRIFRHQCLGWDYLQFHQQWHIDGLAQDCGNSSALAVWQ